VLKQKLDVIKASHLEISNRISQPSWKEEEVGRLARHFKLQPAKVQAILEQLREWGFAKKERKMELL